MGMKYVSAYLMAVLGGKEAPTAKDVEAILTAGGVECDAELAKKLVDGIAAAGKPVDELIAAGRETLKGFGAPSFNAERNED